MPGIYGERIYNEEFITQTPYIRNIGIAVDKIDDYQYISAPIEVSYNYKNIELENEIQKLKNQINKMAEFINKIDVDEEICSKVQLDVCEKYNNGDCVKCIKKYFNEL